MIKKTSLKDIEEELNEMKNDILSEMRTFMWHERMYSLMTNSDEMFIQMTIVIKDDVIRTADPGGLGEVVTVPVADTAQDLPAEG